MGKYAIIGAGPSGLGCAKVFKDLGIEFQGFESSSDVGGLWNISNPRSGVYPNLHLISSRKKTEFKTFKMEGVDEDYPHYAKIFKYLSDFATSFDLAKYFRFNSYVEKITKGEDDEWVVKLQDGFEASFDGVIIATGTCGTPNYPEFEGVFSGDISHSSEVKDFSVYKGKRVLVVGGGNSGSDMACELSRIADHVGLSMRKGNYIIPKYLFGKPADQASVGFRLPNRLKQFLHSKMLTLIYGNPERFGMPKPDCKIYERHPIINSQLMYQIGHGHIQSYKETVGFDGDRVIFSNGVREDFDAVICATGFKLEYPFINDDDLNWSGYSPKLYLNIFNPDHPDLFVLGMVESLGLGWEGRYQQALLVGKYLQAKEERNEKAKMFEEKMSDFPDTSGGFHYEKSAGMSFYVHNKTYMGLLSRNINFF